MKSSATHDHIIVPGEGITVLEVATFPITWKNTFVNFDELYLSRQKGGKIVKKSKYKEKYLQESTFKLLVALVLLIWLELILLLLVTEELMEIRRIMLLKYNKETRQGFILAVTFFLWLLFTLFLLLSQLR